MSNTINEFIKTHANSAVVFRWEHYDPQHEECGGHHLQVLGVAFTHAATYEDKVTFHFREAPYFAENEQERWIRESHEKYFCKEPTEWSGYARGTSVTVPFDWGDASHQNDNGTGNKPQTVVRFNLGTRLDATLTLVHFLDPKSPNKPRYGVRFGTVPR